MKWQSIVTWGWLRPKRRSATQSREEVGEANNQDERLKRRVAETIKRVESDIPEPLRPYLTYRGAAPEPLGAKWFPRELTIEAPGQDPQRVEVYQDGFGFLYARIIETK
jgi:hypothetical protein